MEANATKVALDRHRTERFQELQGYQKVADGAKAIVNDLMKHHSIYIQKIKAGVEIPVTTLYEALATISSSWQNMVNQMQDLANTASTLIYDLRIQLEEERRQRYLQEYYNEKMVERVGSLIQQVIALHPEDEAILKPLVERVMEVRQIATPEDAIRKRAEVKATERGV